MPKKLNFLGGQQNYDPENGEYLPDLTNAQGEPVKGFKSFKKSDEEKNAFNEYNDKRTGKESAALKEQIEKNTDYKEIMEKYKSGDKSEETDAAYQKYTVQNDALVEIINADNEKEKAQEIIERAKTTMNSKEYKELKQKVENGDANPQELDDYWKPIYEKQIAETVIENLNDGSELDKDTTEPEVLSDKYLDKIYEQAGGDENKMLDLIRNDPAYQNMKTDQNDTFSMGDLQSIVEGYVLTKSTNETPEKADENIGKITKYSPFMRQADGTWKKDDTQQKRIKTLHNGLGIETKAQDKEHIYHEQVGKYRLIDVETGTTVGWAKDYEDALKKSQDESFIGAINRAKKVFLEKHPELKEQPKEEKIDYNAKRMGKEKTDNSKKEMEKARKKMEKYWARTNANEHMKSEMDYLLSNYEHDNGKQFAIDEAKRNIQKWQRFGYLDTNPMRDEKLVYFQKMIEYMENNL